MRAVWSQISSGRWTQRHPSPCREEEEVVEVGQQRSERIFSETEVMVADVMTKAQVVAGATVIKATFKAALLKKNDRCAHTPDAMSARLWVLLLYAIQAAAAAMWPAWQLDSRQPTPLLAAVARPHQVNGMTTVVRLYLNVHLLSE